MHSILIVSHSYPLNQAPFKAKFIQDQVLLFTNSKEFKIDVLNLTPKVIPLTKKFKDQKSGFYTKNERISRTTYISLPRWSFPNTVQSNISRSLLKFLKRQNTDYSIIHLHWLYPAGLTIKSLKKNGYKVLLSIHGSDWYKSIKKTHVKPLLIEALKEADLILLSGSQLKFDINKAIPETVDKTVVAYNFIDSNIYKIPTISEKEEQIKRLSYSRTKLNILTVGSLRIEKGIDLLINSLKNIDIDKIQLHIIGLIEDTDYSSSIIKLIQDLELSSVIHLHGPKSPTELVNYYSASDFYVQPSRNEGFGLALIEAMASGLPIISNPTGIANEIITNNEGILNSDFEVQTLSNSLNLMIQTYQKFDKKVIRNKAINRFGMEIFKKTITKHYESIIEV